VNIIFYLLFIFMSLVNLSEFFFSALYYFILLIFLSIHEGVFKEKKKQSMLGKKPKRHVHAQRITVQFIFHLLPSTSYFLYTYALYIPFHPSLFVLIHSFSPPISLYINLSIIHYSYILSSLIILIYYSYLEDSRGGGSGGTKNTERFR
jgi:hypothetical protein